MSIKFAFCSGVATLALAACASGPVDAPNAGLLDRAALRRGRP